MAYEYLNQFYDSLMENVPYHKYLTIIEKYIDKKAHILDLACGTGNMLLELVKSGYTTHGLDISEEMLTIAKQKLMEINLHANLFQDDMRNIQVENNYELIICLLDSINYLTTAGDIKKTFSGVYQALKKGGYFIFDIFAFNRVEAIFANYSYNESDDDYTYIWNTFVEKKPRYFIVNHEFIFFIKSQNNYFHKYLEYHQQVIFPLKVYLELLSNIGFEIKDVYFDFEKKQSENDSERIILVAKKCCT